ncbi:hypothetical protein [Aquimarina sp. MMG016]|uniref:hypothetical protein n=1 Tax=Aquimarina sp. MMG016 TaxID=2822690 RepID=UPI001B3A5A86|nr:hypothetical protein [Aquimarina sp. MMG016]MBQ4820294.1 hypothetical protein [Aquimarina sp. MMG016]
MKRIHAFEFEDLQWFPKNIRNYMTDFLQFGANTFDIYKSIVPILNKGIQNSGTNRIIDLASGGGGGWLKLVQHLVQDNPDLKITLSDYYPNTAAFKRTKAKLPRSFDYINDPVDAMNVPIDLKGFRTQFLSLHHFRPSEAKAILQNAVDTNQPIGIFEAQQRDIKSLVPMLLSPISVILMTPFIKPFRLDRLLFTYIIPILPLFILWDGVISVFRTYTTKELQKMTSELDNSNHFDWEIGTTKGKPSQILYVLGIPEN